MLNSIEDLETIKEAFLEFLQSSLTEVVTNETVDLTLIENLSFLLFNPRNHTLEAILNRGFHLNDFTSYSKLYLEKLAIQHSDVNTALRLSGLLLNPSVQNGLGFYDEHPFIQNIIMIRAACDHVGNDPKNPYVLHQKLLQEESSETYLEPIFSVDTGPKPMINWIKLREIGSTKPFTYNDMTNRISFGLVEALFDHLYLRVLGMPPATSDKAKELFMEKVPYAWEDWNVINKLKGHLLHEDRLTYKLLKREGLPEDEIPCEMPYLNIIFKSILEEDDEFSDEEPLSARDLKLLNFALRIDECSTGQRDGIITYYSEEIPSHLKIRSRTTHNLINTIINHAIQDTATELLQDHAFLLRLLNEEKITQGSHLTLYLRNRYGKAMGLDQKVTFDLGTHTLPLSLLNENPQKVFGKILQELSSEH